jgi:hypothetical protein
LGEWSGKKTRAEAVEYIKSRQISTGDKYWRVREAQPNDGEFGPKKNKFFSRRSAFNRLDNGDSGIMVVIVSRDGKDGFAVRKVLDGLPEREPNFSSGYDYHEVVPELQKAIRCAAAFDYGVRSNGLAYTRYVAGTRTYSKHSKRRNSGCKGEACDLYFPLPPPIGNNINRQRELAKWAVAHANELNLHMVISERTYWSREYNFQPRYYSGIPHVSHTHWERWPLDNGPVCY